MPRGEKVYKRSVYRFDLNKEEFDDNNPPSLNCGREDAASCVQNGKIYVVAGSDGDRSLNTIEVLDVAGNASEWTIFTLKNLTPRVFPVVCPLNDEKIIIAGGYGKSDAITMKTKNEDQEGKVVHQPDN